MKNCIAINKIVRVLVFFILSGFLFACKKDDPKPDDANPFDVWIITGETTGRSGPGYTWRLSTDSQAEPNGHIDLAGTRLFYLNAPDNFSRDVTLTVTKLQESSLNPSFRVYGRFQQCLQISAPTMSSGDFISSGIFQREGFSNTAQYAGIIWTPALAKSPVNSKATFKFKVFIDSKDSLCTEGFVQVDMTAPAAINSAGSYADGDYLYFVKKK